MSKRTIGMGFLVMAMASAGAQQRSAAEVTAETLLARATDSRTDRLSLARLQVEQASRLAPELAAAWPHHSALRRSLEAESALYDQGLAAIDAGDPRAVLRIAGELRRLDRHSPLALDLLIRFNARLADRGGAINRLPLGLQASPSTTKR